ncbi:MAG: ferredoxin--NADP reductase [Planctomycetota bacterium]
MKWTRGLVRKKNVWADGLFTLEIEAPEVEDFDPGQFLQLGYYKEDGRHLHRPYSVASPYGEVLDFFIVLVPDGQLTPKLWSLEAGDTIDVGDRAAGRFTLKHCPEAPKSIWLIATGTGLAPYIAMLRKSEIWERYEKIALVHGVRHASDLAYTQELAEHISRSAGQLSYVPVVSRENVEGALEGRITGAITSGQLESTAGLEFTTDSCVMMCGNPAMLDETEAILGDRGLEKHERKKPGQIVVERYW